MAAQRTDPWPLGSRLKKAREAAKLSQRQAAARAGFSVTTWGQLESGIKKLGGGLTSPMNPRATIVISAAQAVGLDPAKALQLAKIDPSRHKLPQAQRPLVSQSELLEYYAQLDEDERQALLMLIKVMLRRRNGGDGTPVVPPMGKPKAVEISRTPSKQRN